MTFLGGLVLVLVVGGWVYVGIKLVPIYLNYMKVAGTLDKVKDEFSANPSNNEFAIRKAIERHFDIESVDFPSFRDIVIKREGSSFQVTAAYDDAAAIAGNISVQVQFNRTVEVPAN
ncbi:MAG: DUF4845 domain-containing protein [Gammaproteobacteria bacterium]|nr:DUF4845 domain-containing protein [Gammaproteobacteria bacterium]